MDMPHSNGTESEMPAGVGARGGRSAGSKGNVADNTPNTEETQGADRYSIAYCPVDVKRPEDDQVLTQYSKPWPEIAAMLTTPKPGGKHGPYIVAGKLRGRKRAKEETERIDVVFVDGDASFDPDTGEITDGAPPIDAAIAAMDATGLNYSICHSHSFEPARDYHRWRIGVPAHVNTEGELKACVAMLVELLNANGCPVDNATENADFGRAWFVPRCRPENLETVKAAARFRTDGKPLDVAAAVRWYAGEQKAESIIKQERDAEPQRPTDSFIDTYNAAKGEAWWIEMLQAKGYKLCGRSRGVLKFRAPGSKSGMPGVKVFRGRKGDLVGYSHHGEHDPLSRRTTDAFGVLTALYHGGDQDAALKAAKLEMGVWNEAGERDHLRGFDEEPGGDNGDNGDSVPKRRLEVLSLIDLMDDESPDEPNYVEPDFLGPGNFCLVAGPPKAQKSFFVMELLLACATGGKFLDGLFSVPRPLKVFYLQAEMGRRLLKKRAKMSAMISSEERRLIDDNFAVTSRISMRLDDKGVKEVVAAIKERFPDGGPDVIAIDPLANVFDGESEDKAPEVMKFLTQRVEAIRHRVNPAAAVVLVHHSGKRAADVMAADPFSSIRGSGALRGYYDTGVVIYRRSEESPDRRIHFELREGESPEPVTARLSRYGTFEVIDTSLGAISRSMAKEMLEEIDRRWQTGKPLAKSHVAGERCATRYLARKFEVSAEAVKKLVEAWLDNDIVADSVIEKRTGKRGLEKVQSIE